MDQQLIKVKSRDTVPRNKILKKRFYNWFLEKYTDWFTYSLYMFFAISVAFQGLYAHVLKGQNIFYSIYNTYAFFIVSEQAYFRVVEIYLLQLYLFLLKQKRIQVRGHIKHKQGLLTNEFCHTKQILSIKQTPLTYPHPLTTPVLNRQYKYQD